MTFNNAREGLIKLNSLTSFRFIAALLVYFYHVGIAKEFQTGYLGVSFFFMLSGFILVYNYKEKLIKLDPYQLKRFYIARVAKIYPIHFLTFLLAIPYYFFIPLKHEPFLYVFQAITNLLLIHSFIPFGNVSFNGVSWSLSDEMFFYLLFPFIVFYWMKVSFIKLVKLFVFIWIMTILLALYIPNETNFSQWFFYFFPGIRIVEFIGGMILGGIFLKVKNISNVSFFLFSFLEFFSILLFVGIVLISPQFSQNLRYGLMTIPAILFIIFVFAFQKGILSKFLSLKLFVYLGEISFSFYMVHNLFLSYILFLWKPNIDPIVTISVCFLLSISTSSLLFHLFEEPMRKKTKKILAERLMNREKRKITNTQTKAIT
ncbi:acyltransferase family protein [Fictibacillus halophilus]|uniref:acyltransferase family protein n=1 Tax=Fictibacillus halophilus TaxID=1610490 RepID=UPI003628E625